MNATESTDVSHRSFLVARAIRGKACHPTYEIILPSSGLRDRIFPFDIRGEGVRGSNLPVQFNRLL